MEKKELKERLKKLTPDQRKALLEAMADDFEPFQEKLSLLEKKLTELEEVIKKSKTQKESPNLFGLFEEE